MSSLPGPINSKQQILSMFVTLILLMLVDEIINEMNELAVSCNSSETCYILVPVKMLHYLLTGSCITQSILIFKKFNGI